MVCGDSVRRTVGLCLQSSMMSEKNPSRRGPSPLALLLGSRRSLLPCCSGTLPPCESKTQVSQSARSSCVWGWQAGSPRTCPHTAPPRPHAKPTPEAGQESQSQGLPTTHVLPNLTRLLCLRGKPGRIRMLGHTPAAGKDRPLTLRTLLLTGRPLQRSIGSRSRPSPQRLSRALAGR